MSKYSYSKNMNEVLTETRFASKLQAQSWLQTVSYNQVLTLLAMIFIEDSHE
jgi:hypothetical protein